jgi:cobalt/nickel transport system permease protein
MCGGVGGRGRGRPVSKDVHRRCDGIVVEAMARASHPPTSLLSRVSPAGSAGWIRRLDPRTRVVTALLVCLIVALVRQPGTLAMAWGGGVLAVRGAGIGPREAVRRLVPLNTLMLVLIALVPLGAAGVPLLTIGSWSYSRDGLQLALIMTLKANAIMTWMIALLASLELTVLGHALVHLRVPEKLAHLLLLTVRYMDVLHGEYLRLVAAMKVRGFSPRTNWHTMRVYGYLVGMLLMRGTDRAHRIVSAMKCRGFTGRFHLLDHFALTRRDLAFGFGFALFLTALVGVEWLSAR